MNLIFVIILVIIIIIFYASKFIEQFNISQNLNNQYGKIKFLIPPNSTQQIQPIQSDIDYQDYLDNISGYDSATRTYDNPFYAQKIASQLDTN